MGQPKPSDRLFPNFTPAVISVGIDRLKQIAEAAEIAIDDLPAGDIRAIAKRFMERLKEPSYFLHHVTKDDETKMAAALGIPDEKAWIDAHPITDATRALPDYAKPSWKKDVWNAFQKRAEPAPSKPRTERHRDPTFAAAWPELATTKTWNKLTPAAQTKITLEIAEALSKEFSVEKGAGARAIVHLPTGIRYVPVPGGTFHMGLSKDEQALLRKTLRSDPEAAELLKGYAAQVRPDHDVQVPAFLCSKTPLLEAHVKQRIDCDCANVHGVARMTRECAAELVSNLNARLLTEAEWEWVARADGKRQWLIDGDSPREGIEALSTKADISRDEHPFGVSGLAWGTWVDDGWQPTYKKSPVDGSAFTPMELPEVVRGGGLDVWPWQGVAEAMMTHVSFRDRDRIGDHAVLTALSLPKR